MIKRILENKLVVGGICLVLAAVLAFVVLPSIYKSKEQTVSTYKLQADVEAGTQIQAEMLKQVEIGSYGLPASVVKEESEIVGKYTKTKLLSDDLILTGKLSDYASDERLGRILAEGRKLVSVTVGSNAASVSNHLKAGDTVTLICYLNNTAEIPEELKNIEVFSVENENAVNIEEPQGDEKTDNIAAAVTLIVDEAQAKKIVNAEYAGKIHILFEKRGG